jgi:hypothetical protein
MGQIIRPDGGPSNYTAIDESSPDDSDFIPFTSSGTGITIQVSLSDPARTPSPGSGTVRFRARRDSGPSVSLTCAVLQGATQIAISTAVSLGMGFATYSFTPDLSAVSDWTDLHLRFVGTASSGTNAGFISWAEVEVPGVTYADSLSFSASPAFSISEDATFSISFTETAASNFELGSTSSASIHAFARQLYGEIWFVVPIGGSTSHNYYAFCVEESERQQAPVWFKGGISASAILDDPLLGADSFWSCLRIPDNGGASLVSFDKRSGGDTGIEWSLTSSAFYIDEGAERIMLSKFIKDFERQDGAVTLGLTAYDEPNGDAVSSGNYAIATADTRKDFRLSGKLMTMEFSGSDRWRLGKPAFEMVALGER